MKDGHRRLWAFRTDPFKKKYQRCRPIKKIKTKEDKRTGKEQLVGKIEEKSKPQERSRSCIPLLTKKSSCQDLQNCRTIDINTSIAFHHHRKYF